MFGAKSMMHWIIVGAIVLLLFGGRNKISNLMGDVAAGIKAFKKGMKDDGTAPDDSGKTIDHSAASSMSADARKTY